MQLEALCITLGIVDHIPALSEWRDGFLREKAEEMQVLAAELTAVRAALAASQATLAEHQAISDQLVVAARAAIAANDVEALGEILHQAGLFGSAREADRIDLKTAALQAELDALAAAKAALPSLLAY